jgi:hypothetical protein
MYSGHISDEITQSKRINYNEAFKRLVCYFKMKLTYKKHT